jgi:flagellar biosynthesis protein FliR
MDELVRNFGLWALGMARCLPLVWLVPAFGGPRASLQLRLAFAGALSVLCLPILVAHVPGAVGSVPALLVVREILVGGVMGFVCACWFRAAETAGGVFDALCGFDFTAAGLEGMADKRGDISGVMLLFAIVVFLEIGGVGQVMLALARSYEAIPVSDPVSIAASGRAAALGAIASSGKLIEAALGLCAPVVVALILADLVLGAVGRAAPEILIHVSGVPLRTVLGIGLLLLGFGAIRTAMQASLAEFLGMMGLPMRPGP